MKKILKTLGVIFLLIFISLCFGLNASQKGYQISLTSFLIGTTNRLGPDFALNIGVTDQIASVIYIVLWCVVSFLSGKKNEKAVFTGMMIYSALPFIGLIGFPFLQNGLKAGIMMIAPLVWGYPFFPLIITQNSVDAVVTPLGIMMFVMPFVAIAARFTGRKIQF